MTVLLKEISVGSAVGAWYLRVYEDSVSQDIATNISTPKCRITLRCSVVGASITFSSGDAWLNTTHFNIAGTHSGAEHDLGTVSAQIGHAADGTGSYSMGFGISTTYALSGSSTASNTLPTIPRASSISSITGNTLGSAVTVNISRATTSFTHKVKYQFGSIVREYAGQATACTFTPPLTDASQIPSTYYGAASITVTTYNGSTQIGNPVTSSVTLYLPASVLPTFTSLTEAKVNTADIAAWNKYVQNKSKATLTINGAAGIYGSTIKSYLIRGPGFSSSASSATTGILTQSGNVTFTATITDSRGRTATKSVTIAVVSNGPPSLSLKAERCTSAGVVNNAGTYIKISPVYSCASVDGKNAIASKSFKITGTSYADTTVASGGSITLGANAIVVSKSYEVTGVVTDVMGQTSGTIKVIVPSSAVPMNMRDDGIGIAFGKYSEKANTLDSAWPIVAPRLMIGLMDQTYANSISAETMLTNNWFRSIGATGWYSQTYNGGIYMTDTTWIRVYNNKKFYVANTEGSAIYTSGGITADKVITANSGLNAKRSESGADNGMMSMWRSNVMLAQFTTRSDNNGIRFHWYNNNVWANYMEWYSGGLTINANLVVANRCTANSFYSQDFNHRCISSGAIMEINDKDSYLELAGSNWAKGIYYTVSDIAFKKDIEQTSITDAISVINQLQHVQFNWKDTGSHVDIGYIANDVKEVMPGLVFNVKQPDGSDQYNINQTTLLPLITKALQEQDTEIQQLKDRLSTLEKQMAELLQQKGGNL